MNIVNKNIIQKTIVDLHYNGSRDAFELQAEISDWCSLQLTSGIGKVLEVYADTGDYTRIDKLELLINVDMKDDWLVDLSKQISELLGEKLTGLSLEKQVPPFYTKQKRSPGFSFPVITREQNFFETFTWFLQKGYLPWWSAIKTKAEFSEEFSAWISEVPDEKMKTELNKLSRDETILRRITDQLSPDNFFDLIRFLYAEAGIELGALLKDIIQLAPFLPVEKRSTVEMKIQRSFWMQSAKENKIEALERIAEEYAAVIFSEAGDKISSVQLGSGILKKELKKAEDDPKVSGKTAASFEAPEPVITKEIKPVDLQAETGEAIFINNAGLIIIAPFLPVFFKKLNIINEDRIIDESLAVCLVNYLANYKENVGEFELGLAKILCGIKMEMPVSTMVTFTGDQKNEANELLLSVIEYWNILKDTSVEGLQQSFLQRAGKLTFGDKEWLLQVEQKGYDMLLQHLPWNISMIKLPWMSHLLKTEWVY